MKKYILSIVGLSVIGAVISSALIYQHFFPYADAIMAACGGGLDNPCAALNRSGYTEIFGIPIAGYGLIGYFILIITSSMAVAAGDTWHAPCFAVQAPVAAASVVVDVILGSILIYLKLTCRLCVATYAVNILLCVSLFVWYLAIKEDGTDLRSLYRGLLLSARNPRNRPALLGIFFVVLFMVLFVFSASAYLKVRGAVSEPLPREANKFEEYYFSITQEELSLPAGAMSLGDPSTRIRIIVFTDFLCTACMKFYEVERYLMSRFPGKVRVEYHHFPLDMVCNPHIPKTVYPNACIAAQAFSAAARRGIFRECIEYHYGHYRDNLSRFHSGDVMAGFKKYFNSRSSGGEYRIFLQETLSEGAKLTVHDDIKQGAALKVRAVPTIFINGRRIEGVPDAKLLESVLSRELKDNQ